MCGLIGFVTTGGKVDLLYLHELAALAERRGPHAFGFAWRTKSIGEPQVFKMPGPYSTDPDKLDLAGDALALIGHARLSTSGTADDLENNQPLHVDPILIAHNGTVADFKTVAAQHKLRLKTDCDSEALGRLIVSLHGSLGFRVERAIKEVGGEQSHALLALTYARGFVVFRRGHPLYEIHRPEGVYFSSWPPDKTAKLLPEGRAISFRG